MTYRHIHALAIGVLLLFTGTPGVAQDVTFSHWKNFDQSGSVTAAKGAVITITVTDTCDKFDVTTVAVPDTGATAIADGSTEQFNWIQQNAESPKPPAFADLFDCISSPTPVVRSVTNSGTDNYRVDITPHDASSVVVRAFKPATSNNDYLDAGGKILPDKVVEAIQKKLNEGFSKLSSAEQSELTSGRKALKVDRLAELLKKLGVSSKDFGDASDLKKINLFVYVNETGWRTEFAGGFAASRVVNHKYSIVNSIVNENKAGEDSAALGLGAFVHLSNQDWGGDHWAVSFGLGVNSGSDLSLFFGPSWRMGGLGFVTAGYNWARVDTLPNGQELGQAPTSPSVLGTLGKRTESGVFLSWTYPFLGSAKDALKKPFAPVPAPQPAPK